MNYATIITSVSSVDGLNCNGNSSVNALITSSYKTSAGTLPLSGSAWAKVPTGSLATLQYLFIKSELTNSIVDIAANNTASTNIFARLNYNDGFVLPPSASIGYWARVVSNTTASLKVIAIET